MSEIHFIDVTNRDTVQASRIKLSKLQKTMVNIYLGEMGIYQSEFAFPYVKHEQNYVRANLELEEMGAMRSLILEGWCRAVVSDVAEAITAGVKHLNPHFPYQMLSADRVPMVQYLQKGSELEEPNG